LAASSQERSQQLLKLLTIIEHVLVSLISAIIDRPSTGAPQQAFAFHHLVLTSLVIPNLPCNAGTGVVRKQFDTSRVAAKWSNSVSNCFCTAPVPALRGRLGTTNEVRTRWQNTKACQGTPVNGLSMIAEIKLTSTCSIMVDNFSNCCNLSRDDAAKVALWKQSHLGRKSRKPFRSDGKPRISNVSIFSCRKGHKGIWSAKV
jgi:Ribosomal protein L14